MTPRIERYGDRLIVEGRVHAVADLANPHAALALLQGLDPPPTRAECDVVLGLAARPAAQQAFIKAGIYDMGAADGPVRRPAAPASGPGAAFRMPDVLGHPAVYDLKAWLDCMAAIRGEFPPDTTAVGLAQLTVTWVAAWRLYDRLAAAVGYTPARPDLDARDAARQDSAVVTTIPSEGAEEPC